MKTYQDPLDEKLDALDGPGPARRGDRWPTHRAKARAATKFTKLEEQQHD